MREALTEERQASVEPRDIDQHARPQRRTIEALAIPPDGDLIGRAAAHAFERRCGQPLPGEPLEILECDDARRNPAAGRFLAEQHPCASKRERRPCRRLRCPHEHFTTRHRHAAASAP
jgi:hypothetical protein